MSLTKQQQTDTIAEFNENIRRLGQPLTTIAVALHTTPETIAAVAQLNARHIEDPWILRNYLLDQLHTANIPHQPFTALIGDYRDYWFLNSQRIARGHL